VTTEDLYQDDHEKIESLLLGRRIVEVGLEGAHNPVGRLVLDDGTELELTGNDGGCACTAGCYPLTHIADLPEVDHIITAVSFINDPASEYEPSGEGVYQIFVYADNVKVNLVTFEGSDGNGYYGTGYHIKVRRP
jgi:hypothetical protein